MLVFGGGNITLLHKISGNPLLLDACQKSTYQTILWCGVAKVKYLINLLCEVVITYFVSITDVCVQALQMLILQTQILGGMPGENCIIKVTQ